MDGSEMEGEQPRKNGDSNNSHSRVLKKWTFFVIQNPDLQFDYTLANAIKEAVELMGGTLVSECLPDTIVIESCSDKFNKQVLETLPQHGKIMGSSDFFVSIRNIINGAVKIFSPKDGGATGTNKTKRTKRTLAQKREDREMEKRLFAVVLKQAQGRPSNLNQVIQNAKEAFPTTYERYGKKLKPSRTKNLVYGWRKKTRREFSQLFENLDENIKLENQLTLEDKEFIEKLVFDKNFSVQNKTVPVKSK